MEDERLDELARLRAEADQVEADVADTSRVLDELAIQMEGGPEADRRFYQALAEADDGNRLETAAGFSRLRAALKTLLLRLTANH